MRHAVLLVLTASALTFADELPPIACQVKALTALEHRVHEAATQRLLRQVLEVKEQPTGYAWRLPVAAIADAPLWVEQEQKCCPFLLLALRFVPRDGELWVDASSADPRAKVFLKQTFIGTLASRHVPGT